MDAGEAPGPGATPGGEPGATPAPALLIHCSLAHSGAWGGVTARLGDALAPVAVDLPGHGRAPPRDPGRDVLDEATERARAAAPGGLGGAHLIGHSFGAVVALRLALEDGARSLVLIEPVLFAAARGSPAHAEHLAAHAGFAEAIGRGDAEAAARAFHAIWGDGRGWDALSGPQRAYMAERIDVVAAQTPGLDEDRAGLLAPGRLEALDVSVLLIEGSRSPAVVAATQAALAARLPRARRVVIEGAGHMAPVTQAGPVAAAIGAFLAEVARPA